jgi:hypothetical protein
MEKKDFEEFSPPPYNQYGGDFPPQSQASTLQPQYQPPSHPPPQLQPNGSSSSWGRSTSGSGSSGPNSSSSGFSGFLKSLTGGSHPDPLNPPPPSFSRAPARNLPYSPFTPCVAKTIGNTLETGFVVLPPPTQMQPHPFATHDVNEEDWTRFLGDLQHMGKLSPMNKIVAGVAPIGIGGVACTFGCVKMSLSLTSEFGQLCSYQRL